MKILISFTLVILIAISSSHIHAKTEIDVEYNPERCGEIIYNGLKLPKYCMSRDYTAKKIKKPSELQWALRMFVSGGHPGSIENSGDTLSYNNQYVDFKGHIWDYSKQEDAPLYFFSGDNYIIDNATLYDVKTIIGNYIPPNFKTNEQSNVTRSDPKKFIYATKNPVDGKTFNNVSLLNSKLYGSLYFSSWDGIINNNLIYTKKWISRLDGSKAVVSNNIIYSDSIKTLNPSNIKISTKNKSTDMTQDIIDEYSIPCVLHVKFSPDTLIDGNTFNLNHQGDAQYAIVLDHSPRVRIINNTFNGFKVPILMDQWSSIVDEKGNVINPDQFSGDVTMNRKGEIVKK